MRYIKSSQCKMSPTVHSTPWVFIFLYKISIFGDSINTISPCKVSQCIVSTLPLTVLNNAIDKPTATTQFKIGYIISNTNIFVKREVEITADLYLKLFVLKKNI